MLLLLVLLLVVSITNGEQTIYMVSDKLTDVRLQELEQIPEVISIKSEYSLFTLIVTSEASQDVANSLDSKGYKYVTEEDVINEQTVTWNIDRTDQANLPLDGQFNPPGFGAGTHIYVVDTGIRIGHDEFSNGNRASRPFVVAGEPAAPCNFHGSWVASIAAGQEFGVAKQARVYDMKVARASLNCNFFLSDIIEALLWIYDNGQSPTIVNLSFRGGPSVCLDFVIEDLRKDRQAVILAAAGNDGSSTSACTSAPSGSAFAIAIGSTNDNDHVSSFSTRRDCVVFYAPGANILGAAHSSDSASATASGTSASCPHATGVVAIAFQVFGFTNALDAISQFEAWSVEDVVSGSGRSNALLVNFDGVESVSTGSAGSILYKNLIVFFMQLAN